MSIAVLLSHSLEPERPLLQRLRERFSADGSPFRLVGLANDWQSRPTETAQVLDAADVVVFDADGAREVPAAMLADDMKLVQDRLPPCFVIASGGLPPSTPGGGAPLDWLRNRAVWIERLDDTEDCADRVLDAIEDHLLLPWSTLAGRLAPGGSLGRWLADELADLGVVGRIAREGNLDSASTGGVQGHLEHALIDLRLGRMGRVMSELSSAVEADRRSWGAHYFTGRVYSARGRGEDLGVAFKHLREALSLVELLVAEDGSASPSVFHRQEACLLGLVRVARRQSPEAGRFWLGQLEDLYARRLQPDVTRARLGRPEILELERVRLAGRSRAVEEAAALVLDLLTSDPEEAVVALNSADLTSVRESVLLQVRSRLEREVDRAAALVGRPPRLEPATTLHAQVAACRVLAEDVRVDLVERLRAVGRLIDGQVPARWRSMVLAQDLAQERTRLEATLARSATAYDEGVAAAVKEELDPHVVPRPEPVAPQTSSDDGTLPSGAVAQGSVSLPQDPWGRRQLRIDEEAALEDKLGELARRRHAAPRPRRPEGALGVTTLVGAGLLLAGAVPVILAGHASFLLASLLGVMLLVIGTSRDWWLPTLSLRRLERSITQTKDALAQRQGSIARLTTVIDRTAELDTLSEQARRLRGTVRRLEQDLIGARRLESETAGRLGLALEGDPSRFADHAVHALRRYGRAFAPRAAVWFSDVSGRGTAQVGLLLAIDAAQPTQGGLLDGLAGHRVVRVIGDRDRIQVSDVCAVLPAPEGVALEARLLELRHRSARPAEPSRQGAV